MTFAQAKAAFEAEPPVRILFENGAGKAGEPGAPVPAWEQSFASWPPPSTHVRRLWLQPDGTLALAPTVAFSASVFTLDPGAGGRGIVAFGSVWDELPHYQWNQPAAGAAAVFVSEPLTGDAVMVGPASADLWLRSLSADDADLEVNLSEVRPDLTEVFVQSGWLRASQRKLDPAVYQGPLWPEQLHLEADVAKLAPGEWVQARVGIAPFAHVFRAGSRLRLSIDTPGDSRAEWRFRLLQFGSPARYQIGHDASHPSSLAFPLLSGVVVPTAAPPCNALRGQQCRAYAPYANEAGAP
jgi:predicted acyl esterase